MSLSKPTLFATLIAGALAFGGFSVGAAAAAPASVSKAAMTAGIEVSDVQQVQHRRWNRHDRYDRRHWRPHHRWHRHGRWHGPRFRYRRPGYTYFYGGWWYPFPWWMRGPAPVVVLPY
ncbi:hypothetical protein [Rhodoligotrophos ferricapiens]|uniref:hypothetical protein n=1 Tax=Rhodoligotrophos ferricapiens TaxID=3069264 RepID=UPI00315DDD7A